jgi:hypothetical protein
MKFPWKNIAILVLYILFIIVLLVVFHKENILWIGFAWLLALAFSKNLLKNNEKTMETAEKVWVPVSVTERLPKLVEDHDTKSKVVVILIEEIIPEGGEYYGDKRCDLVIDVPNLAFYRERLGWCWSFGDQIVPSVQERIKFWLEEKHNSCGCNR